MPRELGLSACRVLREGAWGIFSGIVGVMFSFGRVVW